MIQFTSGIILALEYKSVMIKLNGTCSCTRINDFYIDYKGPRILKIMAFSPSPLAQFPDKKTIVPWI